MSPAVELANKIELQYKQGETPLFILNEEDRELVIKALRLYDALCHCLEEEL